MKKAWIEGLVLGLVAVAITFRVKAVRDVVIGNNG